VELKEELSARLSRALFVVDLLRQGQDGGREGLRYECVETTPGDPPSPNAFGGYGAAGRQRNPSLRLPTGR